MTPGEGMGQYSLSGEVLFCCPCLQVSLITLASHGLVDIPADEVQEKVDKTVGVSDILPICVATTVHTFVQQTAVQVVCVYSCIFRYTTSGKGSLERSGKT